MRRLEICSSGMVTAVGLTSAASCAAIRAGISRVQETLFTIDEVPLFGSSVPVEAEDLTEKLLRMVTHAVKDCLGATTYRDDIPIILCLPELSRPGVPEDLDRRFLGKLRRRLGLGDCTSTQGISQQGRVGGVHGLIEAGELIEKGDELCVVAAVDSLLSPETLTAYHQIARLKIDGHPDGFIPGEAASALLVRRPTGESGLLECLGGGLAMEPAPLGSEEPLRAEGLSQAIRAAFQESGSNYQDIDYRITDVNGEHYSFKEAALALTRTLRERRNRFEMWHPVESVGEVGAATVPLLLGVALTASRRGYAPGPGVLCHVSADSRERAALVLRAT